MRLFHPRPVASFLCVAPLADGLTSARSSILGSDTIHCGFHLEAHIVDTVLSSLPSSAYAIITDTNVGPLFLPSLEAAFTAAIAARGLKSRLLTYQVAPGEEAKSRAVKAELEDWLLEERCTRDTVVLALGGGVIGDLSGFVAATLCVPSAYSSPSWRPA